jgi:hypothetical protein
VGATGGKHTEIRKPPLSSSYHYSSKHMFITVLKGQVNCNYELIMVDAGANRRNIFKHALFQKASKWKSENPSSQMYNGKH